MSEHSRQLTIHRETPASWRVTFRHPPLNLVDHATLQELHDLTGEIEAAQDLKVVVFDSADPDFFLAHWDLASVAPARAAGAAAPSWIDISLRLAQAPVVTIALVRGRARGIGSEIALGLDMRFASLERAIFGQPEVGVGLVPGGGGMERLALLAGRARALEIVLGAADFDAATAERYGWINRALPDAQLDDFVAGLARRLASFDKPALAAVKRTLNRQGLPTAEELQSSQALFYSAFRWPGTAPRVQALQARGLGTRGDVEMRLGEHLRGLPGAA